MAARSQRPKLIAIVGPTASGKSKLALKIARKFNGEIIAADSRTVYKGMDIGTAKPTIKEQAEAPHHLLDLIEPNQKFSAGQFKKLAEKAISDIQNRGHLPILVGGTGLYLNAVLFDYQFKQGGKPDPKNPRHQLRQGQPPAHKLIPNALVVGLAIEPKKLEASITRRAEAMAKQGFMDEVKNLAAAYPAQLEVFKSPGYRPFFDLLLNRIDLQTAKQQFIQSHLRLVKKQRTWFKRNPYIIWFEDGQKAYNFIVQQLS